MKTIHFVVGIVLTLMCLIFMGSRDIGRYPDKIWLHRCNSMEKLYEKHIIYPNIELDLVFRKNRKFDVTHDVDTSFNLSLASYFSYMRKEKGKMWLDIKNLTLENRMMALSSLDKLVAYFQIKKNRLIIEGQDWKALEIFTQNGYYTSYYIPYTEPDDMNAKEVDYCIKELQGIADKKVVSALSFPGCWYTEIKEGLNRSIDLLTWQHRSTQLQLLLSSIGREMLFDPQVKVILVKDKGKFHR